MSANAHAGSDNLSFQHVSLCVGVCGCVLIKYRLIVYHTLWIVRGRCSLLPVAGPTFRNAAAFPIMCADVSFIELLLWLFY